MEQSPSQRASREQSSDNQPGSHRQRPWKHMPRPEHPPRQAEAEATAEVEAEMEVDSEGERGREGEGEGPEPSLIEGACAEAGSAERALS